MKYEIELDVEDEDTVLVFTPNHPDGVFAPIKPIKEELKPPERWRADKGGCYYYISANGLVHRQTELYTVSDDMLYNISNYYRTREEAGFESGHQKIINELKLYIAKNISKERLPYWILTCDMTLSIDNMSVYPLRTFTMGHPFVFETKEDAEAAVNAIGKERLIKYLFRIKEEKE